MPRLNPIKYRIEYRDVMQQWRYNETTGRLAWAKEHCRAMARERHWAMRVIDTTRQKIVFQLSPTTRIMLKVEIDNV